MCLAKLVGFKVHEYQGWQGFYRLPDGRLVPMMRPVVSLQTNCWVEDCNTYSLPYQSDKPLHKTGYHVFLRKRDAEYWVPRFAKCFGRAVDEDWEYEIHKVRFKKVVAKGSFDLYRFVPMVVVRQRYIEE